MVRVKKWFKKGRHWGTALVAAGAFVSLSAAPAQAASQGTWANVAAQDSVFGVYTFAGASGVAVDASGDIFYTNYWGDNVVEGVPHAAGYTWKSIYNPTNDAGTGAGPLAVTSNGTVFFWNSANHLLWKGNPVAKGSYSWSSSSLPFAITALNGLAAGPGGTLIALVSVPGSSYAAISEETGIGTTNTWSSPVVSSQVSNPTSLAVDSHGDLFITSSANGQVWEATPAGTSYNFSNITGNGQFSGPAGLTVSSNGVVYVANANLGANALEVGFPNGTGYNWSSLPVPGSQPTAVSLLNGNPLVLYWNGPALDELVPPPPALQSQPVTVNGNTTQVIGDLGYNSGTAVQSGTYVGYVEERAAIAAGASYTGEGIASSYLSAILDGSGVGQQQHVSAVQQGQFAALYQKLGIIPTWSGNTVTVSGAVQTMEKASASTLAIENYLVQIGGFSWSAAMAQAQAGFPVAGS